MFDGMSLQEMEAAGKRAANIRSLQATLDQERRALAEVNKYVKSGMHWEPTITLKEGKPTEYWNSAERPIQIKVRIPAGVVQQAAVDAVARLEREIIKLGGTPSPTKP